MDYFLDQIDSLVIIAIFVATLFLGQWQHRRQLIQEKEMDYMIEFLVQLSIWHNKTTKVFKKHSKNTKKREEEMQKSIKEYYSNPNVLRGIILLSNEEFGEYYPIFHKAYQGNSDENMRHLISFINTIIKKYREKSSRDVIEKKIKLLLNIKPDEDIRKYMES